MPEELRDWRLVTLTGWTFDQIDAAPSARLDFLLRVDTLIAEIRQAKQNG